MPHWCLGLGVVFTLASNSFLYKSHRMNSYSYLAMAYWVRPLRTVLYMQMQEYPSVCVTVCHKWGYEVDNVTVSLLCLPKFLYCNYMHENLPLFSLSLSWNSCIITCIIIVLSILPLWFCLAHRSTLSLVLSDPEGHWIATVIERLTVSHLSSVEMEYVRGPAEKERCTLPAFTLQTSVCVSPCGLELRKLGKRDNVVNFTHLIFMETMWMWHLSRYSHGQRFWQWHELCVLQSLLL